MVEAGRAAVPDQFAILHPNRVPGANQIERLTGGHRQDFRKGLQEWNELAQMG